MPSTTRRILLAVSPSHAVLPTGLHTLARNYPHARVQVDFASPGSNRLYGGLGLGISEAGAVERELAGRRADYDLGRGEAREKQRGATAQALLHRGIALSSSDAGSRDISPRLFPSRIQAAAQICQFIIGAKLASIRLEPHPVVWGHTASIESDVSEQRPRTIFDWGYCARTDTDSAAAASRSLSPLIYW